LKKEVTARKSQSLGRGGAAGQPPDHVPPGGQAGTRPRALPARVTLNLWRCRSGGAGREAHKRRVTRQSWRTRAGGGCGKAQTGPLRCRGRLKPRPPACWGAGGRDKRKHGLGRALLKKEVTARKSQSLGRGGAAGQPPDHVSPGGQAGTRARARSSRVTLNLWPCRSGGAGREAHKRRVTARWGARHRASAARAARRGCGRGGTGTVTAPAGTVSPVTPPQLPHAAMRVLGCAKEGKKFLTTSFAGLAIGEHLRLGLFVFLNSIGKGRVPAGTGEAWQTQKRRGRGRPSQRPQAGAEAGRKKMRRRLRVAARRSRPILRPGGSGSPRRLARRGGPARALALVVLGPRRPPGARERKKRTS
jgi:hypothetical protein